MVIVGFGDRYDDADYLSLTHPRCATTCVRMVQARARRPAPATDPVVRWPWEHHDGSSAGAQLPAGGASAMDVIASPAAMCTGVGHRGEGVRGPVDRDLERDGAGPADDRVETEARLVTVALS